MSRQTLDSLCSINHETLDAATPMDMEFRYLDISAVTKGRIDWSATKLWKYADAPSRARRRLRSRDVLLCTVRPGLQAHARIQQEADAPLVGSTGFAVLRPKLAADSGFVFHQIFSDSVALQLRALETGSSYPAVNEGDVKRVHVYCPEKEERWRIAAVLDRVDEAIAKTEAVIAKLRQVRSGLLYDLLTRGLDAHGQLRDPIAHPEQFQDSPLGQIPKEWAVKSLRQLTEFISYGFTNPMPTSSDGPWMLTAFDIGDGEVKFEGARHTTQNAFDTRLSSKSKPAVGDILVTKDGTLGRAALVDRPGICINQSVAVLHPWEETDAEFVLQYLRSPAGQRSMLAEAGGSTIRHIYITKLAEVVVPYPEAEERHHVTRILADSESQIQKEESAWAKLQHLKSGLMTDLLTGRVRVPETIRTTP